MECDATRIAIVSIHFFTIYQTYSYSFSFLFWPIEEPNICFFPPISFDFNSRRAIKVSFREIYPKQYLHARSLVNRGGLKSGRLVHQFSKSLWWLLYKPESIHMMATASFIGLTPGKRLLSSSFYYSDLTEKLSNVNDHGVAHYQITTTKSVIVAKKSSKYGPSFPSSYRNPHSNKALKELIDTASASSTVATWFKTLDDFEEESSVLDYSVEALILLQKSMLEKQWNLSFESINSSDSKIKKSNKKIPVTCSGVSARQRRLNNKRKNQNQSKFMSRSSDFKLLRSDISPDLLLNRLKGYVKGVVSDEVLPHTEVVRLSRIIRAGLSLEDHKSRWEYNINDKRSFVVQCSYLFAHLVFFFWLKSGLNAQFAHLVDSMISSFIAFFWRKIDFECDKGRYNWGQRYGWQWFFLSLSFTPCSVFSKLGTILYEEKSWLNFL